MIFYVPVDVYTVLLCITTGTPDDLIDLLKGIHPFERCSLLYHCLCQIECHCAELVNLSANGICAIQLSLNPKEKMISSGELHMFVLAQRVMMNIVAAARWITVQGAQLNLFESLATRSNPFVLRTAIISTRFYIVLLTIAVMILATFTGFADQLQTVTIHNPSMATFEHLHSHHSTTLRCPCTHLNIVYDRFVNTSYRLHPICSSIFVSPAWIDLLFSPQIGYYFQLDFRSSASGQFQILSSLCSFANEVIQDAIDDQLSDTFLTTQILSRPSLDVQSVAQSQFWQTSTKNTFRRLLDLVRSTTYSNNLQPAMQTSKIHLLHVYPNGSLDAYPLETIWIDHGKECYCGSTLNCSSPSGFFDLFAKENEGYFQVRRRPMAHVTGFVAGCYALESVLQSTLECFFSQTCFNSVLTYFPRSNFTDADALVINETQYTPTTTVDFLVKELFIEDWSFNSSFSAYYAQCAPKSCTYTFKQHSSPLHVLTTVLGLYGGITIVLRFCVPLSVGYWRKRKINRPSTTNLGSFFSSKQACFSYMISIAAPSVIMHYRAAGRWICHAVTEFNLFKTAATRHDPFERSTSKIATRLYLLLMLFSMIIIAIYLLSSRQTQISTVSHPSQDNLKNLYNTYPSTIQCPCGDIAIPYKLFISLLPSFHPVCSSSFVSNAWLVSISSLNTVDSVFAIEDFRVSGQTFFNTVATLCLLAETTVADSWYTASQNSLITDLALPESEFLIRATSILELFKNKTLADFKNALALIEIHTSTMYATGYEDILLYTNESSKAKAPIDFGWMPSEVDTCTCGLDHGCRYPMGFYNYTDNTAYNPYYVTVELPNIFVGCSVTLSTYQSTLECFFNQTCLEAIEVETGLNQSMNVSILETNTSRFSPSTPIRMLIDHLMIETWNTFIQYDRYYEQCGPEYCTYTFTSRHSLLHVVTILVGLLGGLSVVLKIIVPVGVRWIRNRMRARLEINNTTDQSLFPVRSSIANRVRVAWHVLKAKILTLNMFESELSWEDDDRRDKEIAITRVFLLLNLCAVIILIVYTALAVQVQLVNIPNPSASLFDQLRVHPQHSSTLECPCQSIIMTYNSFISMTPHYHQVCSSKFVATHSAWIPLLYSSMAGRQYTYDDYRLFAVPQFQLLAALCAVANETVGEAIARFDTSTMLTEKVQSRETIESKANSTLHHFQRSIPRTFVRTFDFIRSIAQGNGIVSSILSNWHFQSLNTTFIKRIDYPSLWPEPRSYGENNCSCGTSATCSSQAVLDGSTLPGFRVGCYPLEALLQSTLECLYNVSCIDALRFMYQRVNFTVDPLDATLSSPSATVQSLIDTLLVDRWETSVTYEQYYAACAPLACTYTLTTQLDVVYMLTTIIGVYGGLTVVLKLLTPIPVKSWRSLTRYYRRRVAPN